MANDLNQLGAIKVSGDDAAEFLHGQLSCRVDKLGQDKASLGLYCNIKGRIIASFRGFLVEDNYYLVMPYGAIEKTLSYLNKYAVFSKVKLADSSEQLNNLALPINDNWRLNDIEKGIANIFEATQEQFLPHRLNCHITDMIDFNKGCFLGQEVVARMHYKAQLKHHMYRVKIITKESLQPGQAVYQNDNDTAFASIVDACEVGNDEYQALLTLKIKDSNVTEIIINNTAATMELLPLPYSLEDSVTS